MSSAEERDPKERGEDAESPSREGDFDSTFTRRALLQSGWAVPFVFVAAAGLSGAVAHVDSHSDVPHSDTPHNDQHADGPGHTDSPHEDVAHSDIKHKDSNAHQDLHVDKIHDNGNHGDYHSDSNHSDTPHSDTPHTDTPHIDDSKHADAHVDEHGDAPHSDQHADSTKIDDKDPVPKDDGPSSTG